MRPEASSDGRIKRGSWIVRVTHTNQYNWILLVGMGSAAGVFGVFGLIAGNIAGVLFVLLFGAAMAGPGAWWVRRVTRIPEEELQPELDQGSPEEPQA